MYRFLIGDRIVASREGLRTFRNWAERRGTVVGRSQDDNIWQVKWDGSASIQLIHTDFLVLASMQKRAS
jgi:hypothetical protein